MMLTTRGGVKTFFYLAGAHRGTGGSDNRDACRGLFEGMTSAALEGVGRSTSINIWVRCA